MTNHKPYTYIAPASTFPKELEVWDRHGKLEYKLGSIPLTENGGRGFGPGGDQATDEATLSRPRFYAWRPTEPATLTWVVGVREGDAKDPRNIHDRLLALKAPFQGTAAELYKTERRFGGVTWGEKGWSLLRENEPPQGRGGQQAQTTPGGDNDAEADAGEQGPGGRGGRGKTLLVNFEDPSQKARVIWDRTGQTVRYSDPGTPVMREMANGRRVFWQQGNTILLSGNGPSPEGDRPFLDRFDLMTLKAERLFRLFRPTQYHLTQ